MLSLSALAQQEWQYSQYMFNLYDVNGAFAGSYDQLSLSARFRTQWVGFEGAPVSQGISAHLPLGKVNGGLRVLYEQIGARSRALAKGTVAVPLTLKNGRLSVAINAGVLREQWHPDRLSAKDPDEALLGLGTPVAMLPSVDVAAFYQTSTWFAGVQAEHVNGTQRALFDGSAFGLSRHVMAVGGTAIPLKEKHVLRPSALVRYSEGGVMSGELDLAWLWDEKLWLGAGYRFEFGLVAFAEYQITEQLRAGYAYDYAMGTLSTYQQGSHEVFIGWNLPLQQTTGKSVRYFR